MIEQKLPLDERRLITCLWVEEEGFEVLLVQGPATASRVLSDTAFLLKSSALPRPDRSPVV